MTEWRPWKRVGTYLIFVRRNDGGRWDGGYARLKGGQVEERPPSPVTFGHGSEAEAVQAVEGHLQKLPPERPR
jgi:hypothetical protein